MKTYNNNCPLEARWVAISNVLPFVNMATEAQDNMSATDMWVDDIPVQLTQTRSRYHLDSKMVKTFSAMSKSRCRVLLSMEADFGKQTVVDVLKTIRSLKDGNWLVSVRPDGIKVSRHHGYYEVA